MRYHLGLGILLWTTCAAKPTTFLDRVQFGKGDRCLLGVAILWPPARDYWDAIEAEATGNNLTVVHRHDIQKGDSDRFIDDVYWIDSFKPGFLEEKKSYFRRWREANPGAPRASRVLWLRLAHPKFSLRDAATRKAGFDVWGAEQLAAFKARVRARFKGRIRNYILGTIIHVTDNAIERKHVEAVVAGRDVSDKRGGWRTPYKERLKRAERNDRRHRSANAAAEASCAPPWETY